MKLSQAIEKLNEGKFNINYNVNCYGWELETFDKGETKKNIRNPLLTSVLSEYFNENKMYIF